MVTKQHATKAMYCSNNSNGKYWVYKWYRIVQTSLDPNFRFRIMETPPYNVQISLEETRGMEKALSGIIAWGRRCE
jgi:hypothetical protein